ncbi:hypothetical protein O9K51_08463 [Purpureocillium lavendulum]|uniref:Uncharacterized protein n=1 Tax=Purpureocillium lavendulum TaxID=1247861 RepID=A0AB34FIY6_9HYPO|nr:hypothetical protein O9K51_08463 [Purpureocillium lavendulum]
MTPSWKVAPDYTTSSQKSWETRPAKQRLGSRSPQAMRRPRTRNVALPLDVFWTSDNIIATMVMDIVIFNVPYVQTIDPCGSHIAGIFGWQHVLRDHKFKSAQPHPQ